MKHSPSIAVLGGGIAGAAAVLSLTRCGISPIWIAPAVQPGNRVGESLSPAAHRTLEALDATDLLNPGAHRRSNAMFSAWGQSQLVERNSITHLEGSGWVLDRQRFETEMISRAEAQAPPQRGMVSSAHRQGAHWVIGLEDGSQLESAFIIDATGRKSLVGKGQSRLNRADQQVAAWSILEQIREDVEPTRATLIEAVEDGWWYAALLPDGRLSVAWFTDPDFVNKGLSQTVELWRSRLKQPRFIARWIEEAGFEASEPPKLASAGTTWLETCAGENWAAVGDAAAAFDPLSSHGMTTALWTGHQAAEAMVRAMDGDRAGLADYAAHVKAGVETFLAQRKSFYGAEQRFADHPFWTRRHAKLEAGKASALASAE